MTATAQRPRTATPAPQPERTWRGVLGHLAGATDLSGRNGLANFTEDSTNLFVAEWGSFQRAYASQTPAYGFISVGKTLRLGPTAAAGVAFNSTSVEGFLTLGLEAEISLVDLLKQFRRVREVLAAVQRRVGELGERLEGEILRRLEPVIGRLPRNFLGDRVGDLLRQFPGAVIEEMISRVEDFFQGFMPRIAVSGKVALFFGQTNGTYYLRLQSAGKFEVNFGAASGIPVLGRLNREATLQRSWQVVLSNWRGHWPAGL